jgi:hypothetical protein
MTGRGRGVTQWSTARLKITVLNLPTVTPVSPDNARKKFKKMCGVVVRDRVQCIVEKWTSLSDNRRQLIPCYFHVKLEHVKAVKWPNLLTTTKYFARWKSTPTTELVY